MSETPLPSYPALAACILVESRMGSRNELEKDSKATELFQEVKVAKSLALARITMQVENIDCCIIGPGISPSSATDFLSWAVSNSRSKDCAFVAISERESKVLFIDAGAHSQVWKPLTKAKLFDAIVRAVVAANKNSPWTALFSESEFHRQFDSEVASPLLISSARSSTNTNALDKPWEMIGLSVNELLDAEAAAKIFREKEIYFANDGSPSEELKRAAELLLARILPADAGQNSRFQTFCRNAVYTWFEDVPLGGFKEASEQLRMRILQFRG